MMGNTLGVPSPHTASDSVDRMGMTVSRAQFKKANIYSADTNQSGNFFFDTQSLAPDKPLGISKNTFTSIYGARAGSTLSNPAGI
jgi:hypothetical protein